jgi:hypothetical protein
MSRNTETLSISVTKELAGELRAASRRTGIPMARIAAQGMRHRIDELRADRAGIKAGVRRAIDSASATILDLPPGTRLVTADGKEPTPLDVGRIAFVDGADAATPDPPGELRECPDCGHTPCLGPKCTILPRLLADRERERKSATEVRIASPRIQEPMSALAPRSPFDPGVR